MYSSRTVKGSPHIVMPASTHEGTADHTTTGTGIMAPTPRQRAIIDAAIDDYNGCRPLFYDLEGPA